MSTDNIKLELILDLEYELNRLRNTDDEVSFDDHAEDLLDALRENGVDLTYKMVSREISRIRKKF